MERIVRSALNELAERWLDAKRPGLESDSPARRETCIESSSHRFSADVWFERSVRRRPRPGKLGGVQRFLRGPWNIEVETLKQIFVYEKDTLRIVLDNPAEGLKRKKEAENRES